MSVLALRFLILSQLISSALASDPALRLYPGYTTKVLCQGKLHLSVVGSEQLVQLEALPKELGCGVFLRPRAGSGRTNLILETSTGSVERIVEIRAAGTPPVLSELAYSIGGNSE